MRGIIWVMGLAVLTAVLSLHVTEAAAAPRIDRYSPVSTGPRGDVFIYGSDFGTRKPQHSVRYGTGSAPLGMVEIRTWSPGRLDVRLPATIAAGRYWLAIYERDALKSNQLRGLTVEGPSSPPPPDDRPRSPQQIRPGVQLDPPRADMPPLRKLPFGPLRPDRVGTSLDTYTWSEGGPDCPDPGYETPSPPGGGQAYTGYVKHNERGLGGISDCWDYEHLRYRGMVHFDLEKFRGKTIENATLSFRVTFVENVSDSSCGRFAIRSWMILARPFRSGLQETVVGTEGPAQRISSIEGGQVKMRMTNMVRSWVNGDRNNEGIVFVGRDESTIHTSQKCLVRLSDFALEVDAHD